jgi:hypothetical protein
VDDQSRKSPFTCFNCYLERIDSEYLPDISGVREGDKRANHKDPNDSAILNSDKVA